MRPKSTPKYPNQSRNHLQKLQKLQKLRHFLLSGSFAAACTIVAVSLGVATAGGAIAATALAPSSLTTESNGQPEPIVRSSIIALGGGSNGSVTGGTVVTVTGADLSDVSSVSFGGNAGEVVSATDDAVVIKTPASTDLTTGTVVVELFDIESQVVEVDESALNTTEVPIVAEPAPVDSIPADSTTVDASSVDSSAASSATVDPATTPSESTNSGTADNPRSTGNPSTASDSATATSLTFSYVPDPNITAQIDYAMAHWQNYNLAYGMLPGNDCVNFASQSLIARGWTMEAEWSFNPATFEYSPAWISSTAFAAYLAAHPERATAFADDQRASVKVGDIVQFDWDRSGDRDHTGIVTRVDKSAAGVQIYYAAHTMDTNSSSVDESLVNSGGTVSYWSIK